MNHVNAKLANELKKAGFPQPDPFAIRAGQIWYDEDEIQIVVDFNDGKDIWEKYGGGFFQLVWMGIPGGGGSIFETNNEDMLCFAFAPTLEDIAPLLPECVFETWDGSPSCKYMNDEQPRRAFGATFAEAAAKMWLNLKKEYEADFDWLTTLNRQVK